ncbi:hypothetical protein FBU30_006204 [Linnemannia zychae]|nr:hypothetical protein FBU30_006204 [Linnemannia zychae]
MDEYQCFRSRGELVRVQLSSLPSAPTIRYVFWGDLRMCFPGIVRVQHKDIFVPFMRGKNEFRLKPLRIQHIPDILDVIYEDQLQDSHPKPCRVVAPIPSSSKRSQSPSAITSKQPSTISSNPSSSSDSLQHQAPSVSALKNLAPTAPTQDKTKSSVADRSTPYPPKQEQSATRNHINNALEQSRRISLGNQQSTTKGNDADVGVLSVKTLLEDLNHLQSGWRQPEMEKIAQPVRHTMKPAELLALEQALGQGKNPHDLIQDKIRELMQRIQIPGQKPGLQKVQKKVVKSSVQKPTPKQVPGRLRDLIHVPENSDSTEIENIAIEEFIKLSNQSSIPTARMDRPIDANKQETNNHLDQLTTEKLKDETAATKGSNHEVDYIPTHDNSIKENGNSLSSKDTESTNISVDSTLKYTKATIESSEPPTSATLTTDLTINSTRESSPPDILNSTQDRVLWLSKSNSISDSSILVTSPSTNRTLSVANKRSQKTSKTNAKQDVPSPSTAIVSIGTAINGNLSSVSQRAEATAVEQNGIVQEETEEEKQARESALINYELAREGLVATARLFEAFIQASAKGHLSVADRIGLELNRQLRELEAKLGHNSLLRPEFAHLCNALSETQRSLALIREPLIHSRIQAVLAEKMGILDQQVPRIFIILPKPGCPGEFRVHFLCECSEYDGTPKNGKVPKHIHLTVHTGYDIQHKRQFMETYGAYMLDFLNLFKHGVSLDIMTMLPLDPSSKLLAWIHESMEYLLDVPTTAEQHNNGWLRDMASYLQVNPRESCIGSLYRVVSEEGDTRWICREHYEHLQLNIINDKFEKLSKNFKVTYSDPHHSLFHFHLSDREQAEYLYTELEQNPSIQDLGLLLDWTITPKDLSRVLEILKRLTIPVIRLFLQRPERPDDSLKTSKDTLYAYMLGNMTVQVFLMGEIAVNFKRTEPRARLMRVRRDMELKHGARDMFTTLTIIRGSQKQTNISLVYHSVERGLEMVKKHMGANFSLLTKLDIDTGDKELAKIMFKNGETIQLHLRALTPGSNYLLLSSLIRSLNISIWEPHHIPELEKIIKRNQGMDSLDITGPHKIMVSVYNMIKSQFRTHPSLTKVTMKFDGITLNFSLDEHGEPMIELQTFITTGLDEIINAAAGDLGVFFGQPSDSHAKIFEISTGSNHMNFDTIANKSEPKENEGNAEDGSSLENAEVITPSRLKMLNLDLSDMTKSGLESFARVINSSYKLEKLDLRIYCSRDAEMDWESFGMFMNRVSHKITGLLIKGPQFNSLLEQFVIKIPDPVKMLTSLTVFEIRGAGELLTVSDGDEQAIAQSQSRPIQWTAVEQQYFNWINAIERLPKLTHLSFRQVWIDAAGWEKIMDAMNFFKLIRVDIQDANFGTSQMDRLANMMGPDSLRKEKDYYSAGSDTANSVETSKDDDTKDEGEQQTRSRQASIAKVEGKPAASGETESSMEMFSIQLLCVFLCEAPDNDMLQRWDYLLKFRTNQLLYQCEMDPPIAQRAVQED